MVATSKACCIFVNDTCQWLHSPSGNSPLELVISLHPYVPFVILQRWMLPASLFSDWWFALNGLLCLAFIPPRGPQWRLSCLFVTCFNGQRNIPTLVMLSSSGLLSCWILFGVHETKFNSEGKTSSVQQLISHRRHRWLYYEAVFGYPKRLPHVHMNFVLHSIFNVIVSQQHASSASKFFFIDGRYRATYSGWGFILSTNMGFVLVADCGANRRSSPQETELESLLRVIRNCQSRDICLRNYWVLWVA